MTSFEESLKHQLFCEYCCKILKISTQDIKDRLSYFNNHFKMKSLKSKILKNIKNQIAYYLYYIAALEINNNLGAGYEEYFSSLCEKIFKSRLYEAEANAKLYFKVSIGEYNDPNSFPFSEINIHLDHLKEYGLFRSNLIKCFSNDIFHQIEAKEKVNPTKIIESTMNLSFIIVWVERLTSEIMLELIDMFIHAVSYQNYLEGYKRRRCDAKS